MEIKTGSAIPLLDVLVIRDGCTLNTKVYRKLTHTDPSLNYKSNRSSRVKI